MRGLSIPSPRQLALRLGDPEPIEAVWEWLPPQVRERALRVLAGAIARLIADPDEEVR